MQALEISRTGLDVEWRRLEVIAENLANVNTTHTAAGQPYAPLHLISGAKGGFRGLLAGADPQAALAGVEVLGVEPVAAPARRVYAPGHPDADASGYVSYPGVDQVAEMTSLVKTARIYEANVVAMNAARQMYAKALEIGKRS